VLDICTDLQDCYLAYYLTELAGATFMIFTRTCDNTRRMALMLRNLGFDAIPIHGQMAQAKRIGALNKFKAGERSILVATGNSLHFAVQMACAHCHDVDVCVSRFTKKSVCGQHALCLHNCQHEGKLCSSISCLCCMGTCKATPSNA